MLFFIESIEYIDSTLPDAPNKWPIEDFVDDILILSKFLENIEIIQKDLKTLEKAVYSDFSSNNSSNATEFDQNTEDVLTRHLLKLSELENQFNVVTNKFEEINYKLDKYMYISFCFLLLDRSFRECGWLHGLRI